MPKCTIAERHCESCGSMDYEDVNLGDQGYSACCNEIVTDQSSCRAHHVREVRMTDTAAIKHAFRNC